MKSKKYNFVFVVSRQGIQIKMFSCYTFSESKKHFVFFIFAFIPFRTAWKAPHTSLLPPSPPLRLDDSPKSHRYLLFTKHVFHFVCNANEISFYYFDFLNSPDSFPRATKEEGSYELNTNIWIMIGGGKAVFRSARRATFREWNF